jgi:hypothetical protein
MSPTAHRPKLLSVLALGLALGAAGCSMDEVQFNGGVFDAVGLSDSARSSSKGGEPKMAERAPLVVPPNLDSLPAPAEGEQPAGAQIAGIQDPDATKEASKAELERQQAEYCKVNYEQPKRRGDDSADSAVGPLGPCRPSILNSIATFNSGDGE